MVFDVNARRNLTHPHKQCNSQREKYTLTVNWIRSQTICTYANIIICIDDHRPGSPSSCFDRHTKLIIIHVEYT